MSVLPRWLIAADKAIPLKASELPITENFMLVSGNSTDLKRNMNWGVLDEMYCCNKMAKMKKDLINANRAPAYICRKVGP